MQDEDRQSHFPLMSSSTDMASTSNSPSSTASSSYSSSSNSSPSYTIPSPPPRPRSCSPTSTNSCEGPSPPQPPPSAVLTPPAPTQHTRRISLQSIAKMPPIREDANLAHHNFLRSTTPISDAASLRAQKRRSNMSSGGRASFQYQYGEDYITAYDRVGLTPSPTPRPASRTSFYSISARSEQASSASSNGRQGPASAPETDRDLEKASQGESLETEKEMQIEKHHVQDRRMAEQEDKRPFWRRWTRTFVFALVVIILAGLGVGLAFGLR